MFTFINVLIYFVRCDKSS